MKKSEAVILLKEIILKHMNCSSDCCGDDLAMYWTILAEIEDKLGMLPPERLIAERDEDRLFPCSIVWKGNTWKPENEKE